LAIGRKIQKRITDAEAVASVHCHYRIWNIYSCRDIIVMDTIDLLIDVFICGFACLFLDEFICSLSPAIRLELALARLDSLFPLRHLLKLRSLDGYFGCAFMAPDSNVE
jgi:hypothetical protein